MKKGNTKIIAIEGIDGSGKTIQINRLEKNLQQFGYSVETLSFPVYDSFFGIQIGKYLSCAEGVAADTIDAKSMALWFAMDRYAALNNFSTNADFLLLNRYVLSNAVYQSIREIDLGHADLLDFILDLEHNALQLPIPDLYLYLDVNTESAGINVTKKGFREYTGNTKDVYERQEGIQVRARQKYLQYAEKLNNICTIPCMQQQTMLSEEEIEEKIIAALRLYNII